MLVARSFVAATWLMIGASTLRALGQEGATSKAESANQDGAGGGILSGPEIVEERDRANPFSERGMNRRVEPEVPPERWIRILRSLDLTAEQIAGFDALQSDFMARMAAFREEHADTMRLADRLRRANDRDRAQVSPEEIQRVQRIMSALPSIIDVQRQAWDLLTTEQQTVMRERIAVEAARRGDRGASMMDQGAGGDRPMQGAGGDGRQSAPRAATGASGLDEAGERRLRFLRSRQRGHQPGLPPDAEDMRFRFEDEPPKRDDSAPQRGG